jgi:tetratricopeptide (TPR) repeat protein
MNKEYKKAEESLEKALKENPKDEEALVLLAEVKNELGDLEGSVRVLNEAEKYVQSPKYKDRVPSFKHILWVNAYNKGINYFNDFVANKNNLYLDSALKKFNLAISIRSEMPEFYDLKGRVYEAYKDTTRALDSYRKYVQLIDEEYNLSVKKGIYLDIDRSEALKRLDKPASSIGNRTQLGDSILTDVIMSDNKEIFLFSLAKSGEQQFKVKGWRVNPPKHWPDFERSDWKPLETSPLASIAQIYFDRNDYENSLKYVKMITAFEPGNSLANAFSVELYSRLGKTNEALESIKSLAENNPDNKLYWAQYGDLLLNMKDYSNAIMQYEKALKLDPNYPIALLNAATCYKNRASLAQKEELEKSDKDKKYEIKFERYKPDLEKSGEYFEKARMSPQYENDFNILGELVNIYNVLENQTKIKQFLGELEEIEYLIEPTNKLEFYKIMCKTYTDLKLADERKRYCDKFQELAK